ncbi:MAG TPA: ATP-binding cassette domain-containing protein [Gemmatimonadales bacterium]|nr:ATP-binding cassette domain-containing protein [Gemmatimonadales bacterium]
MPLLEVECVGKCFGERRLLSAASLRAPAGTITGLLGRNGIGKSTLLKIATGMVRPDSGVVRYDGAAHLQPSLAQLARRGLFYLPDRDVLSPGVSVRAQLEAVARRFPAAAAPVEPVAEALGIARRLDLRPPRLSGGERRRAEVALAAVRRPRCLLADEPYRGISPLDAECLTRVFRALADAGCAVVLTGHEVGTLLAMADRIVWCTDGTTYEYASAAAARVDERFRMGYLGLR